jgi:hypothetical protein
MSNTKWQLLPVRSILAVTVLLVAVQFLVTFKYVSIWARPLSMWGMKYATQAATYVQPDTATYIQPDTATYDQPDTATYVQPDTATYVQPDTATYIQPDTATFFRPDTETWCRTFFARKSDKNLQKYQKYCLNTDIITMAIPYTLPSNTKLNQKVRKTTREDRQSLQIFLRRFCENTAPELNIDFHFYVGKKGLTDNDLKVGKKTFKDMVTSHCPRDLTPHLRIHFVSLREMDIPPNLELLMQAYFEEVFYYLDIPPNVAFNNKTWSDQLVIALNQNPQRNIGAVGDIGSLSSSSGAYTLTSMFHMDIFGYYYPSALGTRWGHTWIRDVYNHSFVHVPGLFKFAGSHTDARINRTSSPVTEIVYDKIVSSDQVMLKR